jgi:signal transduction histidine kinase
MSGRRELSALRRDGECFPIDASISQARINGQQLYTVILRDVTEIKAAQTELQASHAELQLLFESRLNVQEEERRRIARELHDDLQQSLAAIRMDAAALADQLPAKASGPAPALLRRLDRLAADAIVSTRRIVNDLRPEMLEDLGLAPALGLLARQFQERAHIRCDVDATEEVGERLSGSPIALVGYFRIAQEALTNVAKHSGATQVQIDLFLDEDGAAVIRIHDNGCGMRTGDRRKAQAFGLVGMRERARAMGGVLRINSQPGAGTTIELRVKLPPTDLRPVCS